MRSLGELRKGWLARICLEPSRKLALENSLLLRLLSTAWRNASKPASLSVNQVTNPPGWLVSSNQADRKPDGSSIRKKARNEVMPHLKAERPALFAGTSPNEFCHHVGAASN